MNSKSMRAKAAKAVRAHYFTDEQCCRWGCAFVRAHNALHPGRPSDLIANISEDSRKHFRRIIEEMRKCLIEVIEKDLRASYAWFVEQHGLALYAWYCEGGVVEIELRITLPS